jgi:hypothetical protein
VPSAWIRSCAVSPRCGSRWRRAACWPAAAEHPAAAELLPAASMPDWLRQPSAHRWPPAGWRLARGCRPAYERTARAARSGFRTVWSPVDPRAGQGASRPAGQPPATVHVTRPTPRPGYLRASLAQAPRQGLPVAATKRDSVLGRRAAPPRGLRSPGYGRRVCRRQPAGPGASWPYPTSAPRTRCGSPHWSWPRASAAVGRARRGRPRLRAALR